MKNHWRHARNDGMTDVDYHFGLESPRKEALSADLNELCHVFRHHADGNWKSIYKGKYVGRLADHIRAHPQLSYRLLHSGERVIQGVTYEAIALLKDQKQRESDTNAS